MKIRRETHFQPALFYLGYGLLLASCVLPLAAQPATQTAPGGRFLDDRVRNQIQILHREKLSRTPAQQKLDSQLLYVLPPKRQSMATMGLGAFQSALTAQPDGRVLVDIAAEVTASLLDFIRQNGGMVVRSSSRYRSIRALVPVGALEVLASADQVRSVRPADRAMAFSSVAPEGDIAHRANEARANFLADGIGVKVGVLSDSVDYLTDSQLAGALGGVTVLPGEAGSGAGEGTAMLEIVHSLAPGAQLYFASAFNGVASFAQNIRDLQAAGCNIIVDDVIYFVESPFQDGPIAQAVNDASEAGVLYFSSAGNSGGLDRNTAGTWEGDFKDGGSATIGDGGRLHDFGGVTYDTVLPHSGFQRMDLFWTDPMGASSNDYDVYLVDSSNNVVRASTTTQNGHSDPYEQISLVNAGDRIVIVKFSGEDRYLHLSTLGGRLEVGTAGSTRGHNASGAANAFTVAATRVGSPAVPFVGGTNNPIEFFSSDGPRRMFFNPDGTAITPGDFSFTGGRVLQKPDITAADGVSTTVPNFQTFYGTSAAAPHAAAIAALLLSYNPFLTPAEVRNILTNTALDASIPGFDRNAGSGIVMAQQSLAATPALLQNVQFRDANGNGSVDANECADIVITLHNPMTNYLRGITAVLATSTPDVLVDPAPHPFPDLAPDATNDVIVPFRISTSPLFRCGTAPTFLLEINATNENNLSFGKKFQFQLNTAVAHISAPVTFASTNVPLDIPDAGTIESAVQVEGMNLPLARVRVSTFITHTYDQDLRISLVAPDGSEVLLSTNRGSFGQNYGSDCAHPTVFSDDATNGLASANAPFEGEFLPEESLSLFNGKVDGSLNGTWRLRVQDDSPDDVGTIQCWSLELSPIACFDGGGACLLSPNIVTDPVSLVVTNGDEARFEVSAQGTEPLGYQWYFSGTNALDGQTNALLVLSNAGPQNAGSYVVLVTNAYGSVTSAPAGLTVIVLPTIECVTNRVVDLGTEWDFDQPAYSGSNVTLSVVSTVTNAQCGAGFSATRTWQLSDTNGYALGCSQTVEVVDTNAPVLNCPANKVVAYGEPWQFDAPSAIESGAVEELVYDNGSNDLAQAVEVDGAEVGASITLGGTARYLSQMSFGYWGTNSEQTNFQGNVSVRVRLYAQDGLTNADSGTIEPGTVLYDSGELPVAATTNGSVALNEFQLSAALPLTNALPEQLTWSMQFDGLGSNDAAGLMWFGPAVVGQVGSGYWLKTNADWQWQSGAEAGFGGQLKALNRVVDLQVMSTVTNLDCGNGYTAVRTWQASDSCGHAVQCSQVVQVLDQQGPILTNGPVDALVVSAADASFQVQAASCWPLSYQWYFNETNALDGQTNALLTLTNVTPAHSGSYSVIVTNLYGSLTSAPANLTVVLPANILTNLSDQVATNGDTVQWQITAEGTGPLSYQWYFNETNALDGQTNTLLTLTNVTPVHSGSYSVIVTNLYGASTSALAKLIVVLSPNIVTDPVSLVVTNGDEARFEVGAQGTEPLGYQWYFSGTNALDGQTNALLVLSNAGPQNAGSYVVLVTNAYGSVTSAPAGLTVIVLPTIECVTNRVVDLGTEWDFDQPAYSGSNVTLSVVSTVTNAQCGAGFSATRTWQLSDTNGYALGCSQTVEVVDTNAPVLNCPANKVVAYGEPWQFDAPSAIESGAVEELVYDNGSNDLAQAVEVDGAEVGASITLGGTARYLSQMSFGYWGTNSEQTNFQGNVSVRVRLYAQDGLTNADSGTIEPGTVLYDSGELPVAATTNGSVALNEFQLSAALPLTNALPEQLTWSMQFDGLGSNDAAGLMWFGPAVVGQVGSGYWLKTNADWQWQSGAEAGFGGQLKALNRIVDLQVMSTVTNLDCGNGYTAVRTWQASDSCGHVVQCSQVVQVLDQQGPILTNGPVDALVVSAADASFQVQAASCWPLSYQWYFNETNALDGQTNALLTLTNVTPAHSGSYSVIVTNLYGSLTSAPANLTVVLPANILTNLSDQVATNGDTVQWQITAEGTGPLSYQWYFNETNALDGQTNTLLTLTNVTPVHSGSYSVIVTNLYGASTSALARLTVFASPTILLQPQDQDVPVRGTAIFSVSVQGFPPPSYQWFFNATNFLANETEATLTISNIQENAAGQYFVLVSNVLGMAISDPATLHVINTPTIVVQPQSITCLEGETIFLSVIALGQEPLAYQWQQGGGTPIFGATASTFKLKNVTPFQSGSYRVAITNAFGGVISEPAIVRVLVKPTLISMTRDQNLLTLRFSSVTNLIYSVGYKDDLATGEWIPVTNASGLTGTGNPITVQDQNPITTNRFYRITVQ